MKSTYNRNENSNFEIWEFFLGNSLYIEVANRPSQVTALVQQPQGQNGKTNHSKCYNKPLLPPPPPLMEHT